MHSLQSTEAPARTADPAPVNVDDLLQCCLTLERSAALLLEADDLMPCSRTVPSYRFGASSRSPTNAGSETSRGPVRETAGSPARGPRMRPEVGRAVGHPDQIDASATVPRARLGPSPFGPETIPTDAHGCRGMSPRRSRRAHEAAIREVMMMGASLPKVSLNLSGQGGVPKTSAREVHGARRPCCVGVIN